VFQIADLTEDLRSSFLEEERSDGIAEDVIDAVLSEDACLVVRGANLAGDRSTFFRQDDILQPHFPVHAQHAAECNAAKRHYVVVYAGTNLPSRCLHVIQLTD